MIDDDAQIFVELAEAVGRRVATLSRSERAQAISDLILEANIAYGVWREGDAYRLRLLRCVEPSGDEGPNDSCFLRARRRVIGAGSETSDRTSSAPSGARGVNNVSQHRAYLLP